MTSNMTAPLVQLATSSRRYGSDPQIAFLGGGNTSYKDETHLFIKPSGVALAGIKADDFIALNRSRLRKVFTEHIPASKPERETEVKQLVSSAATSSSQAPASVEAPLHELLPYDYVLHVHPVMVNGMTCGRDGRKHCSRIFPQALWVDYADPGYATALKVKDKIDSRNDAGEKTAQIIFLQNHGVFIAAATVEEIDVLFAEIMEKLTEFYHTSGTPLNLPEQPADRQMIAQITPRLREICKTIQAGSVVLADNHFAVAQGPLTPDHVAYAGSFPYTDKPDLGTLREWRNRHGCNPKILVPPEGPVFTVGQTLQEARNVQVAARNAARIQHLTQAFGGVRCLNREEYRFLEGWDTKEAYAGR